MSPALPGLREPAASLRWCEIDDPQPDLVGLCEMLRAEAFPWLLESTLQDPRLGRFSFLGADAALVARVRGGRLELHCRRSCLPAIDPGFHSMDGDPLDVLRGLLAPLSPGDWQAPPELPFVGGFIGHLGYEFGALIECVEMRPSDDIGFPEAALLFVDRLIAVDHVLERTYALGWGFAATPVEATHEAEVSLSVCREWIERAAVVRPSHAGVESPGADIARRRELLETQLPSSALCSFDQPGYESRVREIIDQIEAGNVYQTNLTQRISLDFEGDPFRLYRALRRESPAPFACFIELPEGAILSSSPERFLRLDRDGIVESRPIKGTRPRGVSPELDAALARELAGSEKDRAENLMIVDLVRNDLGRVCEIGSVKVPELMVVEKYASVFQLVSTVTGQLRSDRDVIDLIRAAFPPGSMTGAPKIAAMKLINRLEPVSRGVYSGAIGYFDLRGGFDLSVVIRTLIVNRGRAHLHVGGAVVADSDPSEEHAESLDKARGMLAAWAAVGER